MQERLQQFLENEILPEKDDRILLAVSGGADSMVMLHLFSKLNYRFEVAHVNFGLRGAESDDDESLVRQICSDLKVTCHVHRVDMEFEQRQSGAGIQETARTVRYRWFDELKEKHGFDLIATAHNKTDHLETIMLHMLRGTGISGMAGIHPRRKDLIRPLLCFTSDEIRAFAKQHSIPYRDDSSNAKDDYLRNRIRHNLVPVLRELSDDVEDRFWKNGQQSLQWLELMNAMIDGLKDQFEVDENGDLEIPIRTINVYPHPHLLLYSIVNTYGFTHSQCEQMMSQTDRGGRMSSVTHEMIRHADTILIAEKRKSLNELIIEKEGDYVFGDYELSFYRTVNEDLPYRLDKDVAYFSAEENPFPIVVRTWREGDRIKPLGMKGSKLVSDLFNESGVPVHRRTRIPILLHNDEIIWVGGIRQSEKMKLRSETLGVLACDLRNA